MAIYFVKDETFASFAQAVTFALYHNWTGEIPQIVANDGITYDWCERHGQFLPTEDAAVAKLDEEFPLWSRQSQSDAEVSAFVDYLAV